MPHSRSQDDEITQPEPLDPARACLRLGAIEREMAELWKMFKDAQPGLAAAQYAVDTAGTAFIGVAELRSMIRDEMAMNRLTLQQEAGRVATAANNRTKLAVSFMAATSVIIGATIGALMSANMKAARAESAMVAETVVGKRLQVLENRDRVLCGQCADEAILRRDRQVDSIIGKVRP